MALVRQELNQAALNRLLHSPQGGVARNMLHRGIRVQAAAKRFCPKGTGRLSSSIKMKLALTAGEIGVKVGSDEPYALDVINGTGIYGPRGTPIRPTRGQYLVFEAGQGSGIEVGGRSLVFAKQVEGQPPKPFLKKALLFGYRV